MVWGTVIHINLRISRIYQSYTNFSFHIILRFSIAVKAICDLTQEIDI